MRMKLGFAIPFSFTSTAVVVPNRVAIELSVSPRRTV